MNASVKEIIVKWYKTLGFPEIYDKEFYEALENYDVSADAKFEDYDIKCEDGKKNLLHFLYFSEALAEKYKTMRIPESVLLDTLNDIVVWTNTWREVKGEMYLGQLDWLSHHFAQRLYKLGRLQYYRGKAGRDIPEVGVAKGDSVLDIHIPASGKLGREECVASLKAALEFFPVFYPDFDFKCFTCHSWLLDSKLKEYLPEGSNILSFAALFHEIHEDNDNALVRYMFEWDTTVDNIKDKTPKTKSAAKIKDAILRGETFHVTLGAIALDEVK